MGVQYRCDQDSRRVALRAHPELNGIDYLEVLDSRAPESSPADELRQRTLLVRFFKPIDGYSPPLSADNVCIAGGVRVRSIGVEWAYPAAGVPDALVSADEQALFTSLTDPEEVLVVRTSARGDFSTYSLVLLASLGAPDGGPPADFDPLLSEVDFAFKVECPSEFDCKPEEICPPAALETPPLNYLAKDYETFRQLMLDRLSVTLPDWQERSAADQGIAVVELLAYTADMLSYHQDSVATEAYLGTARRRTSVRRHARLLDYYPHDGSNSRVAVAVYANEGVEGVVLPEKTRLLTRVDGLETAQELDESELAVLRSENPGMLEFETLHDLRLDAARNTLDFYTWGDDDCCLPKGATRATLRDPGDGDSPPTRLLRAGDLLVFEEAIGLDGSEATRDSSHAHLVRLVSVESAVDPLFDEDGSEGVPVLEIAWDVEDALPFPLCLKEVLAGGVKRMVGVARGNVALADHGRRVTEALERVPEDDDELFRPGLSEENITQARSCEHDKAVKLPAAEALASDPHGAVPAVTLTTGEETWTAVRDLLGSGRFRREFVVEVENEGTAHLRFGDGIHGRRPTRDTVLTADYRVGGGVAGNVGAEAIAHADTTLGNAISRLRNPMPAVGGVEPESLQHVRLMAPQAFRVQERAVTEEDYATMAERHKEVQRAVASRRWTGSWYTVFVTVDRLGGLEVTPEFESELRAWLERFRLAGEDLEVDAPRYVPLELTLNVCVAEGFFRADVQEALLEAFSRHDLPGGGRGFFHPDNFTFGQPVYLSRVIAAAMEIPGVQWIDVEDFHRWGELPRDEIDDGLIEMDRLEIAVLDNDPNAPENGKIEFSLEGGL